jgi:hypothetical protein
LAIKLSQFGAWKEVPASPATSTVSSKETGGTMAIRTLCLYSKEMNQALLLLRQLGRSNTVKSRKICCGFTTVMHVATLVTYLKGWIYM